MPINEPRNWKWMMPSGMTVVFLMLYGQTGVWGAWSNIWLGLATICGVAGSVNLILYVYAHLVQAYAELRAAMYSTPEVRMFEAARGMHPEAVRYLLTQRRTLWRIRYVAQSDLVDWLLDDAPTVHVGFVEFVLDHSSRGSLMPISMLSDGAYTFDPDKLVTDRQQYADLLTLLQQKLMVTQAFGNQSPKWIAPWNSQTVRRRFGLDDDGSAEMPTTALGHTAERARTWSGKDPLIDLEQTELMMKEGGK